MEPGLSSRANKRSSDHLAILSELVAIDLHVAEKIAGALRAGGPATREAVQEILGATPPVVRKILTTALDAA